jgi:Fe-S cluster assembly ATPase SufC
MSWWNVLSILLLVSICTYVHSVYAHYCSATVSDTMTHHSNSLSSVVQESMHILCAGRLVYSGSIRNYTSSIVHNTLYCITVNNVVYLLYCMRVVPDIALAQ